MSAQRDPSPRVGGENDAYTGMENVNDTIDTAAGAAASDSKSQDSSDSDGNVEYFDAPEPLNSEHHSVDETLQANPATSATIDGLRRPFRQGLILARCEYNVPVDPEYDHAPGALIAARNTAVGMLRNGYDMVAVLADKDLNNGSLPYVTPSRSPGSSCGESIFGEQPTQAVEAQEEKRALFTRAALGDGRLVWLSAPQLPRTNITRCIEALACPTNGAKVQAGKTTELTVYMVGHGYTTVIEGRHQFAMAFNYELGPNEEPKGGYTIASLLDDLQLNKRWHHLLIIADACNAGAVLGGDCALPVKAEPFIDVHWRAAYDRESYQFLGSSLADSSALAVEPWRGTLFSMALEEVLWSESPRAFAHGALWATVGHVAEELCRTMIDIRRGRDNSRPDIAPPTCGRLALDHHHQGLKGRPNKGHFLFVRNGAPELWPRGEVTLPPTQPDRQACVADTAASATSTQSASITVPPSKYTERNKLAMVPSPPAHFTGRTAQLVELHSRLMSDGQAAIGNNIAVSATGGVGKSALAAVYATEHANDYTWLLWVHGSTAGTMVASFREAAAYIPLSGVTSETKDEEVIAVVRRWLAHEKGWLMVVDGWDVVTKEMLEMLPKGQTAGKMIVTTLLQNVRDFGGLFGGGGGGSMPLSLDVLEEEDAVEYLLERLPGRKEKESGELREVTVRLGGMPLALELASAYLLEMEHTSARVYLKRLSDDRLKALRERMGDGRVVDHVLATYRPSIERAMEIGGEEMVKKIVQVLGYVEGSGIGADLLRLLVAGKRQEEEEKEEDDFDLALSMLRRLSVVKVKGKIVSVHELVQDVCRVSTVVNNRGRCEVLRKIGWRMTSEIDEESKRFSNMGWSRAIGVHGGRCMEWMMKGEMAEMVHSEGMEVIVRLAMGLSFIVSDEGECSKAEKHAQIAYELVAADESLLTADALQTFATIMRRRGLLTKALVMYQQALAIRESALGSHVKTAKCLRSIATVKRIQGHLDMALQHYRRALSMLPMGPVVEAPLSQTTDIAHRHEMTLRGEISEGMGSVFQRRGELPLALEYYEQSRAIFESSTLSLDPRKAIVWLRIALLYSMTGRNEDALEHATRALVLLSQLFGEGNTRLVQLHDFLGALYTSLENSSLPQRHFGSAVKLPQGTSIQVQAFQQFLDSLW